jgi:hypothetical protein
MIVLLMKPPQARASDKPVCSVKSPTYYVDEYSLTFSLGQLGQQAHCIAVKSSVPQGMIVCFDKEVGWCVGIAVILRL